MPQAEAAFSRAAWMMKFSLDRACKISSSSSSPIADRMLDCACCTTEYSGFWDLSQAHRGMCVCNV